MPGTADACHVCDYRNAEHFHICPLCGTLLVKTTEGGDGEKELVAFERETLGLGSNAELILWQRTKSSESVPKTTDVGELCQGEPDVSRSQSLEPIALEPEGQETPSSDTLLEPWDYSDILSRSAENRNSPSQRKWELLPPLPEPHSPRPTTLETLLSLEKWVEAMQARRRNVIVLGLILFVLFGFWVLGLWKAKTGPEGRMSRYDSEIRKPVGVRRVATSGPLTSHASRQSSSALTSSARTIPARQRHRSLPLLSRKKHMDTVKLPDVRVPLSAQHAVPLSNRASQSKRRYRQKSRKMRAKSRQRVAMRRRRRNRKRTLRRVAQRSPVRSQTDTICGPRQKGFRWVMALLMVPKGLFARIRFRDCSQCTVLRRNKRYCLLIPLQRQTVHVSISASGFQTCTHGIANQRMLRWFLVREDPDALSDSSYRCTR